MSARPSDVAAVALGLAAAAYVLRFGSDAPFLDEWDLTRPLVGEMSVWDWAFGRHNEHLFALPNLLYLAVMRATGLWFPAGMLASVGLLALAGRAFGRAAADVRGFASWGDCFAPAVLLHFGHHYNLLMGFQLAFAVYVALVAVVVRAAVRGSAWAGLLAAAGLCLTGGMGAATAPPVIAWVGWLGVRRRAWGLLGLTLAVAGLWLAVALATPVAPRPAGRTVSGMLTTAVAFVGCAAGEGVSGPAVGVVATLALVVVAVRCRSAGLLAALGGGAGLTAAVAYGRGDLGIWYPLLAAPLWATGWVAAAGWLRWRGLGLAAAVAVAVVALNVGLGVRFAATRRDFYRQMEADLRAGVPPRFVAGKYAGPIWTGPGAAVGIDRLRRHGVGFFRHAVPDPVVEVVPLALPLPEVVCLSGEPFRPGGPPPPRWVLPPPPAGRPVAGLKTTLRLSHPVPWLVVRLGWRTADGRTGSFEVHPSRFVGSSPVEFWTRDEAITEAWLEPGCPTFPVVVEAADWLVR